MAKNKNAKREHYLAPISAGTGTDKKTPPEAESEAWLRLGLDIQTIEDKSDEKTDTAGDYLGDGTEVDILTGRSEIWGVKGSRNNTDEAQNLVASMKRTQTDDDRLLFHKIVETNGDVVIGVAKAMAITAGSGDATAYEDFACDLTFVTQPTVTKSTSTPS